MNELNDQRPAYEVGQVVNGHRWTGMTWEQVGPVGPPGVAVTAPGLATTVWISILFGPFGAIPASRHSAQARVLGLDGGRYWKAFWISWLASWLAGILIPLAALAGLGILVVSGGSTGSAYPDAPGAGGATDSAYVDAPRERVLADIARHCELMTPETAATPEQTTVQRDLLDSMDPDDLLRLEAECLGAGLANHTRDGGRLGILHFAARNSYGSSLTADGQICLDPTARSDAEALYDPTTASATIGPMACSSPVPMGADHSGPETPSNPESQPSETSTRTAEPDSEVDSQGVEGRGQEPKPEAWPSYQYAGPSWFDVCLQSDFPLPGQLLAIGDGEEGGTDPDSEIIRSVQAGLRSLNYGKPVVVDVTGYFGPATKAALTSFQARKGLIVDGQLGQQSWSELNHWVNYYAGNCS